jgi:hypothetical protein
MPSIQDANKQVKEFPNLFISPYGNDGVIPLYSSMPLKSPVEGCLECIVCGNSNVRQQVMAQSGNSKSNVVLTPIAPPTPPVSCCMYDYQLFGSRELGTSGILNFDSDAPDSITFIYNLTSCDPNAATSVVLQKTINGYGPLPSEVSTNGYLYPDTVEGGYAIYGTAGTSGLVQCFGQSQCTPPPQMLYEIKDNFPDTLTVTYRLGASGSIVVTRQSTCCWSGSGTLSADPVIPPEEVTINLCWFVPANQGWAGWKITASNDFFNGERSTYYNQPVNTPKGEYIINTGEFADVTSA